MANAETRDLHPQQAIRRFDVFAEYTRQERQEKGYPLRPLITTSSSGWGRRSTTPCLSRRSPQPGTRARRTSPSGTRFARAGSQPAHDRGR